jgi:hypothetical protein
MSVRAWMLQCVALELHCTATADPPLIRESSRLLNLLLDDKEVRTQFVYLWSITSACAQTQGTVGAAAGAHWEQSQLYIIELLRDVELEQRQPARYQAVFQVGCVHIRSAQALFSQVCFVCVQLCKSHAHIGIPCWIPMFQLPCSS